MHLDLLFALVGALVALGAQAPGAAQRASIVVDASKPGPAISPTLYGIFFEEINHAGDGGLYAELVRNRSFEDADRPVGWTVVRDGDADGSVAVDAQIVPNRAQGRSLRIDVSRAPASGRFGVANSGYWGIAVRAGKRYDLSFLARRSEGFSGAIVASIERTDGTVLASKRIPLRGADWSAYAATLTARAADPSARLVLTPTAAGSVWLDVVSLMPRDTWKGRRNGLRADLAEMLNGLGPAFVRFPGGCYVEGNRLANAFRWKPSIGPIADRPGHLNDVWGYRSTDGLGYHEYLQMCEDLGAAPLFVINCGMAHQDVVPMDRMSEFVQDALDAVEYANGAVTTPYGAMRARNGHPEPFNLRYMEIGNENGGPAYEERYALFYDALKKAHPEIQLVANVPVRSRPMDILDEHYYSSPDFFVGQAHRYDSYPRSGPRIYVGEYAVTQGCGQGNLAAALGEAAFMTGMERNADIVTMCSYAPLFVNANNRAWNPDLIVFDSSRVFGTPSYYVQKLFRENRADVNLPATVQAQTTAPEVRGAIGLGTWATQAEYRDIRVTSAAGDTLYAADLSSGMPGWRVLRGEWTAADGVLRQTGSDVDIRAVAGDPQWTDYTLTLKARKIAGAEGFLILFHVRDDSNLLWWNIGGWGNSRTAIEKMSGGSKTTLAGDAPGGIETGRWYDIRIELKGPRIRCYLDGKLIHDVQDAAPSPLNVCAGRMEATGEIVLKAVNTGNAPLDAEIALDGVSGLARQAACTVLTSASPSDENSFEQPRRVAPKTTRIGGVGPRFRHVFPPHSLTILRIGTTGQ